MLIRIDAVSERPIYAQIADSVRAGIASGSIGAGEKLPPAGEVSMGLGVNKHTVLHAYQLLRDEGLIDLRRGRGAVVTQAAAGIAELYAGAKDLAARAAELGVVPAVLTAIVAHAAQLDADAQPLDAVDPTRGVSRSSARSGPAALGAPGTEEEAA